MVVGNVAGNALENPGGNLYSFLLVCLLFCSVGRLSSKHDNNRPYARSLYLLAAIGRLHLGAAFDVGESTELRDTW